MQFEQTTRMNYLDACVEVVHFVNFGLRWVKSYNLHRTGGSFHPP
jgi:hypothetical protein